MKFFLLALGVCAVCYCSRGDGLPAFTSQPTNQNVLLGNTATFSVAATGATSFQWRFNGTDIPGETNSTLQVPNVQTHNIGYYMAVAQNATGWVPSSLAYLSIGSYSPTYAGGGFVPLSNLDGPVADYQEGYDPGGFDSSSPINDGTAQVVAGPQLDQMRPVGISTPMFDGYFDDSDQMVPTVLPGQTVYYSVAITYPYNGGTHTQPSTILKLVAGGGSYATPDISNLKFPAYIEWPDPDLFPYNPYNENEITTSPTRTCMPGETVSFTNIFYANGDYGIPVGQWRRDGTLMPNGTNWVQVGGSYVGYGHFAAILTLTNVQPSDGGVYDVQVLGNNWLIAGTTTFSLQITNGQGVFLSPRSDSTNFLADIEGMPGRNYAIQSSSNLLNWNALLTVTNTTGLTTLSNALGTNSALFYRAMLLP